MDRDRREEDATAHLLFLGGGQNIGLADIVRQVQVRLKISNTSQ